MDSCEPAADEAGGEDADEEGAADVVFVGVGATLVGAGASDVGSSLVGAGSSLSPLSGA